MNNQDSINATKKIIFGLIVFGGLLAMKPVFAEELILLNGLLTFLGLILFSKKKIQTTQS